MMFILGFVAAIVASIGAGAHRVGERTGYSAGFYDGAFDMWACVNIARDLAKCPRPVPATDKGGDAPEVQR